MKKVLLLAIIIAIIVFLVKQFNTAQGYLGDEVKITVFTNQEQITGTALISVPFLKTLENVGQINIYLDADSDGEYTEEEKIVGDFPVSGQASWQSGFYFSWSENYPDQPKVKVVLGEEVKEIIASTITTPAASEADLATVTNPEEATKGLPIAWAQETEPVSIITNGVPDISQRPAECGPTAAANSLISLIDQHGSADQKPKDNTELIDELKADMNWTPENGTPPDDFVAGKNAWAARHGLPIRTEKVGDANGIGTTEAIKQALQNGQAVELRIKFADANLNGVGGHMVTVTGFHQQGNETYLDINDPYTPEGTETVKISSNQIKDYGPFKGYVILSWAFTQTWETTSTGINFDSMTPEEIQGIRQLVGDATTVKVIVYQGNHIPISQLRVGDAHPPHENGEGCPDKHWHTDKIVMSLEGGRFGDPNPGGCGFGTLKDKPSQDFTLPALETVEPDLNIEVKGGIFGE